MSFHNKPNYQIPELIEALKAHRLPHDTPSQLADSFRIGWMACRELAPAESVPAIQGEMNVQLDIDSNHSAPGQQRDVARSVALGQPMGNGSDQVAGHPSAQEDKLLTVAERNIRSFLRSATFKSESDREAALNCVDVLWAAARDPADSVQEDAACWHWLAEYLVGTRTDLDDEIVASETVNDLRKLVKAAIKQGATQ